jgi:hypothetical protein
MVSGSVSAVRMRRKVWVLVTRSPVLSRVL